MNRLKQRLISGWNFSRLLFVGMGGYITIDSIITGGWFGLLPGIYFLASGLFAFGCMAGSCAIPPDRIKPTKQ